MDLNQIIWHKMTEAITHSINSSELDTTDFTGQKHSEVMQAIREAIEYVIGEEAGNLDESAPTEDWLIDLHNQQATFENDLREKQRQRMNEVLGLIDNQNHSADDEEDHQT